jgi:hypothetical protein
MSSVDKNAEIILVNPTASSGTINLPLTSTLPYRTLTIKHIGSTSLNGITVATQGPDTFEDGTTSYIITQITTFATFYANTSANKWVLVGGTNTFLQTISSLSASNITSVQGYISSLAIDSLQIGTGSGWVNIGPLQTVAVSSIQANIQTGYISLLSSVSMFTSTIDIAGSLFMYDKQLLNYGDLTLSNQSLYINGTVVGGGGGGITTGNLESTVKGLGSLGYLSTAVTQLIAGSNITISPLNGEGIVTINASGGSGGGITVENLESTVTGLGTLNYISGPFIEATSIVANQYMASPEFFGNDTSASTFKMFDFVETSYTDFPVWNSSNQIAGSDPDPSPLRFDVFGSARILKNLYVGSTTTILTTAGIETAQVLTSTMTLSGKGPLFASTNTVTSITDVFLNDTYVAQRVPVLPIIISSLTTNMILQPEFLGMHFLLQNSDPSFSQLFVRADATFVSNVPDGWYCYLKQFPDSNYYNDGVAAETDLGNVPLPDMGSGYGGSNYMAPMKFVVSGGFKIPY